MFKDTKEVKDKIVYFLRRRGPSLPVHVAKETDLTMLFASAFLSELISDKLVKMSNMRIGSSPIYFIPEQEPLLERFSASLKSKERDAYILLKEKKFLKDSELEPAIRVALRAIRDFAIPFKKDLDLYWRYFIVPESELQLEGKLKPQETVGVLGKEAVKLEIKEQIKPEKEEIKKPEKIKIKEEEIKPLVKIKEKIPKIEKSKEKSDFLEKVLKILEKKNIKLIEQTNIGKKEFEGIAEINSDLGKILVFITAKDKKKISEDDLIIAIQKGSYARKMTLFVTTGVIDKKAEDFFNQHQGIVKFLKM